MEELIVTVHARLRKEAFRLLDEEEGKPFTHAYLCGQVDALEAVLSALRGDTAHLETLA